MFSSSQIKDKFHFILYLGFHRFWINRAYVEKVL